MSQPRPASAAAPPPPDPRVQLREAARLLRNGAAPELLLGQLDEPARLALLRRLTSVDPLLKNVPPHDKNAERAVLGALLIDQNAVDEVAPLLAPEQLYVPAHAIVYKAILDLRLAGQPVDVITMNAELTKRNALEQIGGTAFLAELTEAVPTSANAAYYAKIARDHAGRRDMIKATAEIQAAAFDAITPLEDLAGRAEGEIAKASGRPVHTGATGEDLARELWHSILETQAGRVPLGWRTGYHDLDELTQGLQAGDLSCIAARTSMGKTTFLLALMARLLDDGRRVGIVSLEMPRLQLARNIAASRARVDGQRVRSADLTDDEMHRVNDACAWLHQVGDRLYVDDAPAGSASSILARVRRLASRGYEIVMLDYLQRAQLEDPQQQHAELGALSGALKTVASKHGAHVLVVAQLGRKVEDRRDHTPTLSDISGSGQIEADLDLAMLLYRPSYYDRTMAPDDPRIRLLEVHVAKQRNGPIGVVELSFDRGCLLIEDAPEGGFPAPEPPRRKKRRFGKGRKDAAGDDQD